MAKNGTVFFMYHELAVPGRRLCHAEPGYTRYALSDADFRSHIARLAREGWQAKNVTQALQSFAIKDVCLTFDDGCETDLISAAPVLQQFGFGATFYITVEFLGKPGYMTEAQVRDLAAVGFEIGCHSLTHPYLPDIDDARLREETAGAKERLQQIAGVPVEHFSCPGGRWDRRVLAAVKAAPFRTMATSRTGMNFASTDPLHLNRVAVLSGTSEEVFIEQCRGRGLLKTKLKESAREAARSVLGNSNYDSLRGYILDRSKIDT
ncbi:MAG TPA: polysaccharide deacetylase family protein [Candidatus Sulfotelmatobacter sp.]|jgi:peptidoglycan/xylan/chitin deacetylase (PgdA/CDA1 family)